MGVVLFHDVIVDKWSMRRLSLIHIFTVHTSGGTSCELLLFHRGEEEPYAVLPFPDEYRIGDVYSMIVFGLDIEELEYAYRVDGPWDPEKGLRFRKENVLLDPYARAVAGQRIWGEKKEGAYHARVVKDVFDWGDMPQSKREMSDLIIYEMHVRGFTKHPSSGVEQKMCIRDSIYDVGSRRKRSRSRSDRMF